MTYQYGIDHQWHSAYMAICRKRDSASLHYVRVDCRKAITAMPSNPKCAQYMDEIHYCTMELHRRAQSAKRQA